MNQRKKSVSVGKTSSGGQKAIRRRKRAKIGRKPIEQYDHKDKTRVNNPPVGLVDEHTDKDAGKKKYAYDPHIDPALQFDHQRSLIENIIDNGLAAEELDQAKAALAELKKRQEPYLNWAGKAERTSFEVPTVSLHVHERIDPRTIIEAVRKRNGQNYEQMSLFHSPEENPPIREAIEFYKHRHNWSNRLIAGDSLLVMNSLIEKEGLAGQVQMIYIDPPYGITYGSNFQPFVNKRDVKDGKDEDLTAEPEQIRAFRDTWELGIHSYLTYLRDRLLLARELLTESGSVYVQIGEENVHLVRTVLDEVFQTTNFCRLICYTTTSFQADKILANTQNYLLWYAKNKALIKVRPLYRSKQLGEDAANEYKWLRLPDGSSRPLNVEEASGIKTLPAGARAWRHGPLTSQGWSEDGSAAFEYEGKPYSPGRNQHWKTSHEGLHCLSEKGLLIPRSNSLAYYMFLDDFPVSPITNSWADTKWGFDVYRFSRNWNIVEHTLVG